MISSKKCVACKKMRGLTEYWTDKRKPDGLRARCIPCSKAQNKRSYDRNPAARVRSSTEWKKRNHTAYLAQITRYRRTLKAKLVAGYGGKCVCCGEQAIEFLSLEHLNRDGHIHRGKRGAYATYRDAIRENFPPRFTVLCMNCNYAKRGGKVCPHEQARTALAKVKQ